MRKLLVTLGLSVAFFVVFTFSFAQYGQSTPILTAMLDSYSSPAQSISSGTETFDMARIVLSASNGDVSINGMRLGTDIAGGLSNFVQIYIYDVTTTQTLLDTYPSLGEDPTLVQFPAVTIGSGRSKTYLLRARLSSQAAGNIRLGFAGFTFATQVAPSLSGIPFYGNVMTFPGIPQPTPSPSVSPTATPVPSSRPTPGSLGFTSLSALSLKEGDVVSSALSGDPDVYIVNDWGYKRLFLNPVIFGFYSHLGFSNVINVTTSNRNMLVPSGLFRNCEINDPKVYGLETTGEDSGVLHWVNTTGTQAVVDDPEFFKKVFCINSTEFNWYSKGSDYISVNQVPNYSR